LNQYTENYDKKRLDNNMKILIMVQATHIPPFDKIIKGQKETWDSIDVEGVDTIYYYSGNEFKQYGKDLYVKCPQEANMNNYRFKLALDWIFDSNCAYDYIFRTNASSYVNKQKLKEYISTLPKTKVYNGKLGGGFASGCGFVLSTDLVNILRTIDDYPTDSEDCLIGDYLERAGVHPTDAARWDVFPYNSSHDQRMKNPYLYHYRCKSDDLDRTKDVWAMKHIHNLLHG